MRKVLEASPETLRKHLKRRPILWVGAGLSVAAGLPSTNDLLEKMVEDADHPLDLSQSFEKVADQFVESLGKGRLADVLQRELSKPGRPTKAHKKIAQAAVDGSFAAIVTTNYDDLLERTLADAGVRLVTQVLEANAVVEDPGALRLLKLHGSKDDWLKVVLSGKSYEAFSTSYTLLHSQLDVLLRRHSVLFVGCSLLDPRIIKSLSTLDDSALGGLKVWRALISEKAWNKAMAAGPILEKANVQPIYLRDHEHLQDLWDSTIRPEPPPDGLMVTAAPDISVSATGPERKPVTQDPPLTFPSDQAPSGKDFSFGSLPAVGETSLPKNSGGSPESLHIPEPNYTLQISLKLGKLSFHLHWRTKESRGDAPYGHVEFPWDRSQFFKNFFAEIERLAADRQLTPDEISKKLEGKGVRLSNRLLPLELRRRLWKITSEINSKSKTKPTFYLSSNETWIPWEMFRVSDPDSDEVGEHLSDTFFFSRKLVIDRSYSDQTVFPLGDVALVAPLKPGGRTATKEMWAEREALPSIGGSAHIFTELKAEYSSVLEAIASSRFDGWHYIGHGVRSNPNVEDWHVQLDRGNFSVSDLETGESKKIFDQRPLVFLNCCHSAASGFDLTGMDGFANAFLQAGAGGFIGTHWAVKDGAARTFATTFYQELFRGLPIAEAGFLARRAVQKEHPGNPSWLAYVIYSHPEARCRVPTVIRKPPDKPEIPGDAQPEKKPEEKEETSGNTGVTIGLLLLFLLMVLGYSNYLGKVEDVPVTSSRVNPATVNIAAELGFEAEVPLDRPAVVILEPENQSRQEHAWLSTAFREGLGTWMEWDGGVLVIDGQDVVKMERDLGSPDPFVERPSGEVRPTFSRWRPDPSVRRDIAGTLTF